MADCTPLLQSVVDGAGDIEQFPVPPSDLSPIAINASGGFPITLQAATAGMLTRVYRLVLLADAATTVSFLDGIVVLSPLLKMAAGDRIVLNLENLPWYQGSVNTDFKLGSTAAVQLTGAAYINMNPT